MTKGRIYDKKGKNGETSYEGTRKSYSETEFLSDNLSSIHHNNDHENKQD